MMLKKMRSIWLTPMLRNKATAKEIAMVVTIRPSSKQYPIEMTIRTIRRIKQQHPSEMTTTKIWRSHSRLSIQIILIISRSKQHPTKMVMMTI